MHLFFNWFCDFFCFLPFVLECFVNYSCAIIMQDSMVNENNSLCSLERSHIQVIFLALYMKTWKLFDLLLRPTNMVWLVGGLSSSCLIMMVLHLKSKLSFPWDTYQAPLYLFCIKHNKKQQKRSLLILGFIIVRGHSCN